MQQLYRCWSWWIANPDRKPILVFKHFTSVASKMFLMQFLQVLQKEINLEIVSTHDGPYVQAKDTGMWDSDIALTDYAMFDPDRKLRQIFAPNIPNIIPDPPCHRNSNSMHRLPKIAILNRAATSTPSRHLLNAKELAASIEDTFSFQSVPVVYFENKTMLEQAQFFMEHDIVISPHGAQLTGIAFMKNCSTVVEFFPRNYLTVDFFGSLAASVGVNHKYFYLGNNEEQIQSYERYHYIPASKFRLQNLCPKMELVMSELEEVINNWHPCCPVASSSPAEGLQQKYQYGQSTQKVRKVVAHHPSIDIVTIGSLSNIVNQNAQKQTFGSHRFVRNFFPITELNDTDIHCSTNLTFDQYQRVVASCVKDQNLKLPTTLFLPRNNSTEWLCAQKRPIDGLLLALKKYKSWRSSIPDYLILINDDTYLNMDALVKTFQESYPPNDNHLVAGCTFLGIKESHFVFPVDGMGTIITRATMEKIIKPIHCQNVDQSTDPFVQWTCWRIKQNLIGEMRFFQEGMSIGDLIHAYTSGLSFTNVEAWDDSAYCMHGDHALGYFLNYYHVSVPDWLLSETTPTDDLRRMFSYKKLADSSEDGHSGKGGECGNVFDKCTTESRICRNFSPEQMNLIYAQQPSAVAN